MLTLVPAPLTPLADLLALQSGVVARAQLLGAGWQPHDLRRLVRRRELAPVLPGVYVDHTGTPTWQQRAWAAVLFAAPAALAGRSALRAECGPGWGGHPRSSDERAPIEVVIDNRRRVREQPGIVITRRRHLDEQVRWNLGPPRLRVERAALDVAAAQARVSGQVEILAAVVRHRSTTATRILEVLETRSALPGRAALSELLTDLAEGTQSALEHGYLVHVERPHGLPRGKRQRREDSRSGRVYRDVRYSAYAFLVELDGSTHRETEQHQRDLDRDLDAQLEGERLTTRLGWRQCFDDACRTAGRVGVLLQRRGWTDSPLPCSAHCVAPALAGSAA